MSINHLLTLINLQCNSEEPWSVSKWSFFLNHSLWILVRGISQVESGSWVTQQSLWVIVTVPSLCHLETHVGEQSNVFYFEGHAPFLKLKNTSLCWRVCVKIDYQSTAKNTLVSFSSWSSCVRHIKMQLDVEESTPASDTIHSENMQETRINQNKNNTR